MARHPLLGKIAVPALAASELSSSSQGAGAEVVVERVVVDTSARWV